MRLLLVVVLALAPLGPAHADAITDRAKKLHAESIIVDTHIDTPDQLARKWADVAQRGATDHFDIPRATEGGLTAPFFSIYVSADYVGKGAARRALELIDITRRVVDQHPQHMTMATTAADIRAAKKARKIAVLMGIEGGHAIEDSLAVLREMYRAGIRYMTLTHTNTNGWADSSGSIWAPDFEAKKFKVHGGLSEFGTEVVKEMNRLGMIVDISHVSDDTLADVLAVSRAPVMASHSSARAISNIARNLTDAQIKQIAAKGGLVMINFGSAFVDQASWNWFQKGVPKIRAEFIRVRKQYANDPAKLGRQIEAVYKKLGVPPRAQWTKVIDHLEHVIKIAGEDAVGIGSDYDGVPDPPVGLDDVSMLPKITEELLRRGHSEARIKKILGENFLAFYARVEAVKASLAKEPPSTAVLKK